MNKSSILHIPLSQYAFATKERTLTIRLRAAKDDLTRVTLYYGDRACTRSPLEMFPLTMQLAAEDEDFAYYETTFESPFTRVCYYFHIEKEEEEYYYYSDQFHKKLADFFIQDQMIESRSEYYQYPFILRSEILDTPSWFKEAIVYNIFPDSFASSRRYIKKQGIQIRREDETISKSRLGGTIRGVLENLDYIQDLGFTCVYFNPIFAAGEYHKYDLLDYFQIDPCFGSNEDFRCLVEQIHARGMKIIIDGVFNHCGWYFFAFEDVIKNQEASQYKDWFYQLNFPVQRPSESVKSLTYDCFAYEKKMPKLNTANIKVQEYFEQVCRYWIREYHIDGWRLDVANEVDRNFWRRFRLAAKSEDPNVVLIGEVWENSETWLRGDAFDSTMNYEFRNQCRDFFGLQLIDAVTFSHRIRRMLYRYPKNITLSQLNLLDSHDVPRFMSICHDNKQCYVLSLIFLFLSPGVPCLFYGDELGVEGIREEEYRKPMPWELEGSELQRLVKQLIGIRRDLISWEDEFVMYHKDENPSVIVFERKNREASVWVCFNTSKDSIKMNLPKVKEVLLEYNIVEDKIAAFGYGVYRVTSIDS